MPVITLGEPKAGEKPQVRLDMSKMKPSEAEAHAKMIDLPGEEEAPQAEARSEDLDDDAS